MVCPQVDSTRVRNQDYEKVLDYSDPDKYELDLRFHPGHRLRVQEAKHCNTFQMWHRLMLDKFGFISLQDQVLHVTDNRNVHITEALESHKVVHSSGTLIS